MIVMTAVCCHLFWIIVYLHQLNPLIGPQIPAQTIWWIGKQWGTASGSSPWSFLLLWGGLAYFYHLCKNNMHVDTRALFSILASSLSLTPVKLCTRWAYMRYIRLAMFLLTLILRKIKTKISNGGRGCLAGRPRIKYVSITKWARALLFCSIHV